MTFPQTWLQRTELDLRALSLARIALGLVSFFSFARFFFTAETFLSSEGLFPLSEYLQYWQGYTAPSLFLVSDNITVQYVLLGVAALCSLAFTIGFQTKLFHFLTWFFLASIKSRVIWLLQGCDSELIVVLFFLFFLPLNEWYSVDKRKLGTESRPIKIRSWANLGFFLQVSLIYWTVVLTRWGTRWLDGKGLAYSLSKLDIVSSFGTSLLSLPESVLTFLNYSILAFEFFIPFLLFLPRARLFTIICLSSFHLMTASIFHIGLFPFIAMAPLVVFLPTSNFGHTHGDTIYFLGKLRTSLVCFFLALILAASATTVLMGRKTWQYFPTRLARFFSLEQNWFMFNSSGGPAGYWRLVGETSHNETWDFFSKTFANIEIPLETPALQYPSTEWRKYLENFKMIPQKKPLLKYLCRQGANKSVKKVMVLRYILASEINVTPGVYDKKIVLEGDCSLL